MIEFCVLASSSGGNCIYVGSKNTRVLMDAGLSGRQIGKRLAEIGVSLDQIDALCLTHEHSDHVAGFGVLTRKHGLNVFANEGTLEAIERSKRRVEGINWQMFTTGSPFTIGDLTLTAFGVPHDSAEPVGYVVEDGDARVAIATDLGMPTNAVRRRLVDCEAVVLESNHDTHILRNSPRPWSLKQRILGRQGHLSNEQAAELLADICGERLEVVVLAHLSTDCNDPAMAKHAATKALQNDGRRDIDVHLACGERITELIQVPRRKKDDADGSGRHATARVC